MTHSDLQWLRSEMERVLDELRHISKLPWAPTTNPRVSVQAEDRLIAEFDYGRGIGTERGVRNCRVTCVAVNYSAAWARHVLRLIERVEKCECQSRVPESVLILLKDNEVTTRNWVPEDGCEECKSDREDLSALIADMRKDDR